MRVWCFGYVYDSNGKLSYKSVLIITLLVVIAVQTKAFPLVPQHRRACTIGNLHTVLWDYSDLNFAGNFMISGHPDYESKTANDPPINHSHLGWPLFWQWHLKGTCT